MANRNAVSDYRWKQAVRHDSQLPKLLKARGEAEQEVKRIAALIDEYKVAHRTKKLLPEHQQLRKAAKSAYTQAKLAFREAMERVLPLIKDDVRLYTNRLRRELYKDLVTEQGMATSIYDYWQKKLSGIKKFKRWDGTGLVHSVNVQGNPRRCVIEELPDDPGRKFKPGSRRQGRMRKVSISHAHTKVPPLVFRFFAHRDLPPVEHILQVHVFAEKIERRTYYKVAFCVRMPEPPRPKKLAAVAWCWDRDPRTNKIQVCSWIGQDGQYGELFLPEATRQFKSRRRWYTLWERLDRVDDKQQQRDTLYNEIKAALREFRQTAPDWFREATQHMHAWKSQRHLVVLLNRWREQRFAQDEAMFAATEQWLHTDRHWWGTQSHQREATYRQRLEIYRLFAAELSRRYGRIAVVDIKPPVQPAKTELANPAVHSINLLRRRVAASVLKSSLQNKCRVGQVSVEFKGTETHLERARMILAVAQARLLAGDDIFAKKEKKAIIASGDEK